MISFPPPFVPQTFLTKHDGEYTSIVVSWLSVLVAGRYPKKASCSLLRYRSLSIDRSPGTGRTARDWTAPVLPETRGF